MSAIARMSRRARGLGLLLALAVSAPTLAAQHSFAPVDSGKVIRFQAGGIVTRGRLLAPLTATSDSVLFCRFPGPPCRPPMEPWQVDHVRLAMLEHLDAQVGNNAVKGAWIGGVLGAAFSVLGISIAQGFCEYNCRSDLDLAFRGVLVTGVWASLGALIGSGSPKMERRF